MYNIKGNETCLRIIIYYTYRVRVVAHVACIYNIIYNNNSRCIYERVYVCDVHVHQSPERERERAQLKFNPKLLHPFGVLAKPEWVKGLSSTHPLPIRLMCRLRWKRVYIYINCSGCSR